jgi:hypothetical protein
MAVPPPDYEEHELRRPWHFQFPKIEDWAYLLVLGTICVGVSSGDLNNLGQQLTGAALAAFNHIVKDRKDND